MLEQRAQNAQLLDTLEMFVLLAALIYAKPAGPTAVQASAIIDAMHAEGVKRLIFISSMGICGEAPGERYRSVLGSDLYERRGLGVSSA
jgi:nucleoside-diphosphate-sugar epimerase